MSLVCADLTFAYPGHRVLEGVSFTVEPGGFTALLGRNGSGKTSLLHCLAGLERPSRGRVTLDGVDLLGAPRPQVARLVSLAPQEHTEIFPFSVLEVVVMARAPFLAWGQRPGREDYERARAALSDLGADGLARRDFNRISGGERQLVLLARAFLQSARGILLDEPTNHLDFHNAHRVLARVGRLCQERGLMVVASLHDPNLAARYADQVVMLSRGQVVAQGPPREVMTPATVGRLYQVPATVQRLSDGGIYFLPTTVLEGGRGMRGGDAAAPVIILTGPRHGGKTTCLRDLAGRLRVDGVPLAGFASPGHWQGDRRSGFDLEELAQGRITPLSRRRERPQEGSPIPFALDEAGLAAGRRALADELLDRARLLGVDEVGPLELSGGGWAPQLDRLAVRTGPVQIWVVRQSLVEAVCARWGLEPRAVIDLAQDDPAASLAAAVAEALDA